MSGPPIEQIRRLHAFDEQIYSLRERQAALPAAMDRHKGVIEACQKELDNHIEQIKKDQAETHNLEVELQAGEDAVNKHLGQRNTVTTNKEYKAIDHQIETEKMEMRKVEEAILDRMAESEQLLAEQVELEAKIAQETARLSEIESRAAQESGQLEAQIAALAADRAQAAREVPEEILAKYERVLAKHHGAALAEAADGSCSGCYMRLTQQEINQLLGEDNILFCRSCSRVLWLRAGDA